MGIDSAAALASVGTSNLGAQEGEVRSRIQHKVGVGTTPVSSALLLYGTVTGVLPTMLRSRLIHDPGMVEMSGLEVDQVLVDAADSMDVDVDKTLSEKMFGGVVRGVNARGF